MNSREKMIRERMAASAERLRLADIVDLMEADQVNASQVTMSDGRTVTIEVSTGEV